MMPGYLLRNAVERISASVDAFVYLKQRMVKNYAAICVAGYVLGIGDRHLSNFLINYQTGDIILIDFGYSFGDGTRLTIPELIPFRLSKNLEHILAPVGIEGNFRNSMVISMSSLKNSR
jgi:DNA-dependent protein kinase catalytic subunit